MNIQRQALVVVALLGTLAATAGCKSSSASADAPVNADPASTTQAPSAPAGPSASAQSEDPTARGHRHGHRKGGWRKRRANSDDPSNDPPAPPVPAQ